MSMRRLFAFIILMVLGTFAAGCMQSEIEQSQRQLQAQQVQLEKLSRDVEEMHALQAATPRTPVAAPGACDAAVRDMATRKGGERFAANDFQQALGYYEDALVACPQSARAELNVARTYEAIGNRSLAIEHYQRCASGSDSSDPGARAQARDALARLGSASP
jgi:tetratricopeptide (TPR) repeat protein